MRILRPVLLSTFILYLITIIFGENLAALTEEYQTAPLYYAELTNAETADEEIQESKQRGHLNTEWCLVPAGEFFFSENDTLLTIDYDYEIMKYEVTNAQYLQYLREAYAAGDIWVADNGVRWHYEGDHHYREGVKRLYALGTEFYQNTSRISYRKGQFFLNYPEEFSEEDYLNHPVVYVSWFGALAFARHYGLRLPTDHEWEKAARGMTGNMYPWGDSIDGSRANYFNSRDPWDNGTTPVGYFNGKNPGTTDSPSPYGVYDMAGNVLNWTGSWYGGSYPNRRVLRGGSWDDTPVILPSWSRYSSSMTCSDSDIGFRCARTR
jgi:formylglycine-generating enzyme required for sulfatase activity